MPMFTEDATRRLKDKPKYFLLATDEKSIPRGTWTGISEASVIQIVTDHTKLGEASWYAGCTWVILPWKPMQIETKQTLEFRT